MEFFKNGNNTYWSQLDLSGLRDVLGDVTIRFPIGQFAFVVLWNQVSYL